VDDRHAETLISIIQKFVLPGTAIYSDEWAAYCGLAQLFYVHRTVNHSQNFVGSTTGTCTNAIEAYWSHVKHNIHLHWLSDRDQLPLRIDDFLWRDSLPTKRLQDVFMHMIALLDCNH